MSDHIMSSNINSMDYNDNNTKFKVNNKGYFKEIYDSSGNFSKAFKNLYRSGKVKDANHLKFVYNEKTNRFVNKSKIYKKSATKQKILKKEYKGIFEATKKKKIKAVDQIKNAYRKFKSFKMIQKEVIKNNDMNTTDRYYDLKNFDISAMIKRILLLINPNVHNRVILSVRLQDDGIRSFSTNLKIHLNEDDLINIIEQIRDLYSESSVSNVIIQTRKDSKGGDTEQLDPFLVGRKGFVQIKNDDNKCGQRCLVLAMMNDKQRYKYTNAKQLKDMTPKLNDMCNKLDCDGMMTFFDFDNFTDRKVVIISKTLQVLYSTINGCIDCEEPVYLYYDFINKHYHLINNINSFVNKDGNYKWCHKCLKRMNKKFYDNHKCIDIACSCCKTTFDSKEKLDEHFMNPQWINCGVCNLACPSKECLVAHQSCMVGIKTKKPYCDGTKWKCYDCKKWIDKERLAEHKCDEIFCKNCDAFVDKDHRCYITPLKKPEYKEHAFYAFDLECMFVTNKHVCNFANVQKLYNDESYDYDNLETLVDWMLEQKNSTFIAHNGKAYDTWLIHQYIIRKTGERPKQIVLAGDKIMSMKINTISFIDSLNHIGTNLESMPDMFGLDTNQFKKGFFPYKYNLSENQNYVGKIPDVSYFEPNRMSVDKRKEFFKWYKKQDSLYDFRKELVEYCKSDVSILKKSLEVYQQNAMAFNDGLDPLRSPTIASYCMKVFRTNHLKDSKIPILHKDEYDFCKRGFYGGRTNAIQLYKNWDEESVKNGVYGKYQDIQSLYPTVQFYDELPSDIIGWSETVDLDKDFGYVECDVTCPKDLYIPVLPEKKNAKLIFDLVYKTKAVYTTIELKKAVEKGYKITKVYRALLFEKSNDIFKSYVANLLKGKIEASGCNLEGKELDEFIREHKERFGFDIDVYKLKKNPGMRALMKIQLNSLWGKFGQKCDMSVNKYVTSAHDWFKLFKAHIDGKINLKSEKILDNNSMFVEYQNLEEENTSLPTTSVAVAGMTTSNARLRLYKELEKLNERVIYFDTDSVIYEWNKNLYNIPDGKYLGEWEDECKGKPITEFVSIGPKSYSYKYDGKTNTKFKGFTLNYENGKKITFDSIKELLDGNIKSLDTVNLNFKKDKKMGSIYTEEQVKSASFCYSKRQIEGYRTFPFGFVK